MLHFFALPPSLFTWPGNRQKKQVPAFFRVSSLSLILSSLQALQSSILYACLHLRQLISLTCKTLLWLRWFGVGFGWFCRASFRFHDPSLAFFRSCSSARSWAFWLYVARLQSHLPKSFNLVMFSPLYSVQVSRSCIFNLAEMRSIESMFDSSPNRLRSNRCVLIFSAYLFKVVGFRPGSNIPIIRRWTALRTSLLPHVSFRRSRPSL